MYICWMRSYFFCGIYYMFQWLIDLTRTIRYNTPHERLNYSLWWNCEAGVVKFIHWRNAHWLRNCLSVVHMAHIHVLANWRQRECFNPVCVCVGHFENGTSSPTKQYTKFHINFEVNVHMGARNYRRKLTVPPISSGQIEMNNGILAAMTAYEMNWAFSFLKQTYGILQNLSGRQQKPRVGVQRNWTHITHNFFRKKSEWMNKIENLQTSSFKLYVSLGFRCKR